MKGKNRIAIPGEETEIMTSLRAVGVEGHTVNQITHGGVDTE